MRLWLLEIPPLYTYLCGSVRWSTLKLLEYIVRYDTNTIQKLVRKLKNIHEFLHVCFVRYNNNKI